MKKKRKSVLELYLGKLSLYSTLTSLWRLTPYCSHFTPIGLRYPTFGDDRPSVCMLSDNLLPAECVRNGVEERDVWVLGRCKPKLKSLPETPLWHRDSRNVWNVGRVLGLVKIPGGTHEQLKFPTSIITIFSFKISDHNLWLGIN